MLPGRVYPTVTCVVLGDVLVVVTGTGLALAPLPRDVGRRSCGRQGRCLLPR